MPRLHTLDAIEAAVWEQLAAAARDRGHAWRTPVLATSTADGDPQARTVVLREADVPSRQLLFFTDQRSPKATQIHDRPRGVLVMWSAPLGWQLRIAATLEMQVDGLAVSSRWALMKLSPAAHDYLSPLPPGSEIDVDALSAGLQAREGDRGHFALVTATVQCIDWLELHADGHRRARFDPDGAHWLQP
jgi:pyridoxamine 5'-phosphate oxidase